MTMEGGSWWKPAQNNHHFVQLLLGKGCDINFETGGTTALSGASNGGHVEMVKFLISRGADLNRKNGLTGEPALMSAAELGQLGTVRVLLNSGADPCARDNEGNTAKDSRGDTTISMLRITSHLGSTAKKLESGTRSPERTSPEEL